jgi:hypothetical protein
VWAFAKAGHKAPALFDTIAQEAVPRLRDLTPQGLANTVWAFVTRPVKLLDAIAAVTAQRLREFNHSRTSPSRRGPSLSSITSRLRSSIATTSCSCARRSTAFSSLRHCASCTSGSSGGRSQERGAAWPPLPPELARRCHAVFCQEEDAPSLLQRDVAASLCEIGLTPQEEVRTPQGYSLDAVVSEGGFDVAVEVDGPSHFWGRTPTGATALKRRQLRAAG